MCEQCDHQWLHQTCFNICCKCGETKQILCLDTFSINSAPLFRGYNRRSRFALKVRKMIGLHSGPVFEDPVWECLNSKRVSLNSPFDVRATLRESRLKNKHYDSMRTFCDTFTEFRVAIEPMKLQKTLLYKFDRMYARWHQCGYDVFFSYAWILRLFFNQEQCPLICYLKPPTCKRRNQKYTDMYKDLDFNLD